MGKIILRDLSIYAYHGCYEEENKIGSDYKLNIWVEGDFSKAEKTDHINDTVDYVCLADIAANEMSVSSKLIEHVADRILSKILSRWKNVDLAGISIQKISPPMNEYVRSVDYVLERRH